MADSRRIAAALAYQQGQQDPFDAVPVVGVKQPTTGLPPETWYDKLEQLSYGLGTGLGRQVDSIADLVAHPIDSAKGFAQSIGEMVKNPSVIVDSLKAMGNEALSGPEGFGKVVGENMTLNPRKLAMALSHPNVQEVIAYHGTAGNFPEFDPLKQGSITGAKSAKTATWFTDNPEVASGYAVNAAESAPVAAALREANQYEKLAQRTNDQKWWDLYDQKLQEAEKLESESFERRKELARVKTVDVPDELDLHVVDANGKTPQELSKDGNIDSWLQKQLNDAKKANKQGVKILNLDDTAGGYGLPATHYGIFDPTKVKILSSKKVIPERK